MKEKEIMFVTIKTTSNISIKALFKNYKGDYKPKEIDWGDKKGSEI